MTDHMKVEIVLEICDCKKYTEWKLLWYIWSWTQFVHCKLHREISK